MDIPIDNIVSSSEVQKNYKKVFAKAKRSKRPVLVMKGNDPEVAVVDIKVLEEMTRRLEELEIVDTLKVVKEGRKEYNAGKTIKDKSLSDLI